VTRFFGFLWFLWEQGTGAPIGWLGFLASGRAGFFGGGVEIWAERYPLGDFRPFRVPVGVGRMDESRI
jgi:hypothetical protein